VSNTLHCQTDMYDLREWLISLPHHVVQATQFIISICVVVAKFSCWADVSNSTEVVTLSNVALCSHLTQLRVPRTVLQAATRAPSSTSLQYLVYKLWMGFFKIHFYWINYLQMRFISWFSTRKYEFLTVQLNSDLELSAC